MKKFVSFLLLCLFLFTLSTASAQADTAKDLPTPGYEPGDISIEFKWEYDKRCQGKDNTANITIINNTGEDIKDFSLTFEFESDKLYIKGYGGIFSEWTFTEPKEPNTNTIGTGTLYSGTNLASVNVGIYTNARTGLTSASIRNDDHNFLTCAAEFLINHASEAGGINSLGQLPTNETLPQTGFSARIPLSIEAMPMNLSYEPLSWKLDIPSLSVEAEIVRVPYVDGDYPVAWLENKVGLLEGSEIPGEGITVIAGHNNLNMTEIGPFALLKLMETGDRIFVQNENGDMLTYSVYANEKISDTDVEELNRIASRYENSLTLMTCEDELLSGGFANRRIISAKLLSH